MDAIAIKQQLLSQYDVLQSRIKDLKEAAEKEVHIYAIQSELVCPNVPSYLGFGGYTK